MPGPFRVSRLGPRYAGQQWVAPHVGVRAAAEEAHRPDVRIAAAGLVIPATAALTGWAAARLHENEWSDGRDGTGRELSIRVALPHHQRLRRAGLEPLSCALTAEDLQVLRGIRVVTAARAGFDEARLLELEAVVVAVDGLVACRATSLTELSSYIDAHPGLKGVPQAREVLGLASPYAESPPETRMRLFWRTFGIKKVLVNAIVLDERGQFVGRIDLLDEEAGLAGEYQGDLHRDPARWRKDLRRKRRLESLGLIVCEAASGDLRAGSAYERDLLSARQAGLRRDRRQDRWRVIPPDDIVHDGDAWVTEAWGGG